MIVNVLEVTGGPNWPLTHLMPVSRRVELMVMVVKRVAGWTIAGPVTWEVFLTANDRAEEVAREAGILCWWSAEHYHLVVAIEMMRMRGFEEAARGSCPRVSAMKIHTYLRRVIPSITTRV